MAELVLNSQERAAIKALKAAARLWPKSLWLFSASGELCVMRKVGGKRVEIKQGIGFDQDYLVEVIDGIDNDGGDW